VNSFLDVVPGSDTLTKTLYYQVFNFLLLKFFLMVLDSSQIVLSANFRISHHIIIMSECRFHGNC
jgi:hypothetical protein